MFGFSCYLTYHYSTLGYGVYFNNRNFCINKGLVGLFTGYDNC